MTEMAFRERRECSDGEASANPVDKRNAERSSSSSSKRKENRPEKKRNEVPTLESRSEICGAGSVALDPQLLVGEATVSDVLQSTGGELLEVDKMMEVMDSLRLRSPAESSDSAGSRQFNELRDFDDCYPDKCFISLREFSNLKQDVCTTFHKIVVKTFHPEFPELHIRVPKNCIILDVKYHVKASLGLKSDSIDIFGFFEGKKGALVAYVPDHFPVQDYDSLLFQRLSIVPNLEVTVTKYDFAAIQLLYHELMYMVENEKLAFQRPELLRFLTSAAPSCLKDTAMMLFIQRLQDSILSYWRLYYHARYCSVLQPFRYRGTSFDQGDCVNIGLDVDGIILFNDTNNEESLCGIPWDHVRLVKYNPNKQIVIFEIKNYDSVGLLAIKAMQHKLVFTLAVHIIMICETMHSVRSKFRLVPDLIGKYLVFWNDMFCAGMSSVLCNLKTLTIKEHKLRVTRMEAQENANDSSSSSDDSFHTAFQKSRDVSAAEFHTALLQSQEVSAAALSEAVTANPSISGIHYKLDPVDQAFNSAEVHDLHYKLDPVDQAFNSAEVHDPDIDSPLDEGEDSSGMDDSRVESVEHVSREESDKKTSEEADERVPEKASMVVTLDNE